MAENGSDGKANIKKVTWAGIRSLSNKKSFTFQSRLRLIMPALLFAHSSYCETSSKSPLKFFIPFNPRLNKCQTSAGVPKERSISYNPLVPYFLQGHFSQELYHWVGTPKRGQVRRLKAKKEIGNAGSAALPLQACPATDRHQKPKNGVII